MKLTGFLIPILCFVLPAYGQAPVANFSANVLSGCAPLVVKFTDLSTNNASSWIWDLGNGAISTIQNPGVTFINPGEYTIKLTSTNAGGSHTVLKTAYIKVYALPTVNFSTASTSGCSPLTALFNGHAEPQNGTITQWEWNFGDGGKDSIKNPAHIYTNPGNFGVFLKVTNSYGCTKIASKSQYVKVGDAVHADFAHSMSDLCALPVHAAFANTTAGSGVITSLWSFGDGDTNSSANPVHAFKEYGNYMVKLVATNEAGCKDSIIRSVNLPSKKAVYQGPGSLCAGASKSFSVVASPAPASIFWSMGDGINYNTSSINHTYSRPGTFTIRVIVDFGNCRDTLTKTVRVIDKLPVDFSALDTTNCKAPFTVLFTNPGIGAVKWLWDFGDGTTSTAKEPLHTYTADGPYTVTLKAENNAGCTALRIKTNYINISKPIITLDGLSLGGCKPYSFTPAISIESVDSIINYKWQFGDGGQSDLKSPTHIYNNEGTYTLKLFTTSSDGCRDSLIIADGIKTGLPSPVDFSVNPSVVCGKSPVNFTALADTDIKIFKWTFGDGTGSEIQNPVHYYGDTGYFSITLSVENNGCKSFVTKSAAVKVQGPISKFSFKKDCRDKSRIDFINQSIGATVNTWDFGDGTTSDEVNPVHFYAATGEYLVRLTTINGGCIDSIIQKVPVWLEPLQLTFSRDSLCLNERSVIRMIHPNPNAVAAYYWNAESPGNTDFVKTLSSPLGWDFFRPGLYNFIGYTVDSFGCHDTIMKPDAVRAYGPKAYFDVDRNEGCLNSMANFIDTSKSERTNPVVKWSWNFGDGSIKEFSSPPFAHSYTTEGIYSVTLKITDRFGCTDSITRSNFITRAEGKADFSSVDSFTCFHSPIQFINNSRGNIVNRLWDFGDGTTSADQQPNHTYTDSGAYTVKLKITGSGGCTDSLQKSNYITLKSPKAAFNVSHISVSCPPVQINFFDSSYYVRNYSWTFDDGNMSLLKNPVNVYFSPRSFRVKLKVTSAGGCEDSTITTIKIAGPLGKLSYTQVAGCAPQTVRFRAETLGATNFTWDYGNGVSDSNTDSIMSYSYTSTGSFLPTVLLKDSTGCVIPYSGKDTILVDNFSAKFGADKKVLCDSGWIQFSDSIKAASNRLTYKWDFGDGTFSAERNANHFYNKAGIFKVKLTVTSTLGCSDEVSYPDFIKVTSLAPPVISASADACSKQNILFQGHLAQPSATTAWQWVFANGHTSALQNPPMQTFTGTGTFNNSLTLLNADGCSVKTDKQVVIYPAPGLITNSDTVICKSDSIHLSASGLSSYSWTPAAGLNSAYSSNPFASPSVDTWYKVKGKSLLSGCSMADSVLIKVLQPYTLKAGNDILLCGGGQQIQLSAFGAPNYKWSPATGLNASNISNPLAGVNKSITYKITGYDSLGCFSDSAFIAVKIMGYPTIELGPDLILSAGNTFTFNPVVSQDVRNYKWMPQNGISCTTCPRPVLTAANNITYSVKVSNAAGCAAYDSLKVFVTCDNSTIFVPNTFSPNGDGMNDYFYPRGKGVHSVQYFAIFNRWGVKVFEKRGISANNQADGWDGMFNGKKADSGVYIYFMEVRCNNNQLLKYSGNISLIQ